MANAALRLAASEDVMTSALVRIIIEHREQGRGYTRVYAKPGGWAGGVGLLPRDI
jgi:hypothetical protein